MTPLSQEALRELLAQLNRAPYTEMVRRLRASVVRQLERSAE